jgi:hypothetical protein
VKKEEKVLLLNFISCIIIKADEKIIKNFFQNKKINLLMKGGEFMKKKAAKKVVKKVAKKPAKRVVKKVAKKVVKKAVRKVAKKPAKKAAKKR